MPVELDWTALQHARGAATDVPRLMEGLTSSDVGAREAALEKIYATLWHRGTIYPATAAAIPWFVELLEAEGTPDRSHLLLLLADIGRSAAFGDEPCYADAQAALADAVPAFERRLGAVDEIERIAAVVALAWADDGTVLAKHLKSADEAQQLVALYALAVGRTVPDPKVLTPWSESRDAGPRLAARLGLVRAGLPKALGEIDPSAYALLSEIASTVAPEALPQPIEMLDASQLSGASARGLAQVLASTPVHRVAAPLVQALLEAVFPDGFAEPATPLQQEILGSIVNSPGAWVYPDQTTAALEDVGVEVVDRDDLCARLGMDHPDLRESEDTQSLLAANDGTGVRYEDLTDPQRAQLEQFVGFLDEQGWNESLNWHAFVTSGSGYAISPIGVGRHFNEEAVLEVTLWFFDEHIAADSGAHTGEAYVRLLVADKAEEKDPIGFRAYLVGADPLLAILRQIDAHRPTVNRENFGGRFLHDLFTATDRVEVELADGRVLEIRPRAAGSE